LFTAVLIPARTTAAKIDEIAAKALRESGAPSVSIAIAQRGTKPVDGSFQFETECRLGELPTAAGRGTGTFYFALTAGKGSKRGINKS
jgi:hypothetical protein